MVPLSIKKKNTGPDVNSVATQTPELPMITLSIEEKNKGPEVNRVATQTRELPMVGPAGKRTGLDAEPDVSIVEVEIPALIANASIQAEVTPPLSPAFPGEGKSPVKVSSQEGSPVLLRGERHLPNNGRADGKDKRQKRKSRTFSLVVLVFLLISTLDTQLPFVCYHTYQT